jgi:hypothetical protein
MRANRARGDAGGVNMRPDSPLRERKVKLLDIGANC